MSRKQVTTEKIIRVRREENIALIQGTQTGEVVWSILPAGVLPSCGAWGSQVGLGPELLFILWFGGLRALR
jgi:hypothetical protein